MDESVELPLRASMLKELAQYVAPKRKAIEHTGDALAALPVMMIRDGNN